MARKIIALLFLQLICFGGYAQNIDNRHSKTIATTNDTVQLDTLSLIPKTIHLTSIAGVEIDSSYFTVAFADGIIILNNKKLKANGFNDSIKVTYQTFPLLLSKETKHKDINLIRPDLLGNFSPFSYNAEPVKNDIFMMNGLDKSGSISRGISFGNNQDMAVSSNLNLQLSGHLNNNIDILLAATDSNIPIQPEGNTQQLQEFDKVFVQISNPTSKLIAGDFQLYRPESYFMSFHKKAQGLSFTTTQTTNKQKVEDKQGANTTSINAAVSRGKFSRNVIQGIEGNQGPYPLKGAENETFIIILSGTEKVYINGRLLDRGQENDYVIDYNTSEITFTAKQLITKDRRIIVEFQYSDKNYARSLVHVGNDFEQNKVKLHLHVYSEQDNKNQPIQQELSADQKQILSDIGDTLSLAIAPSFDTIAFDINEISYEKVDTIIGIIAYSFFRYNPIDTGTHYRVTYSNVGAGNGNYNQRVPSNANGKVFDWVQADSITGQPLGEYEPVIQLATPQKKQMITAGFDYMLSDKITLSVETAMSNNDINTFSNNNSNDDIGYGIKVNLNHLKTLFKNKDSIINPATLNTSVNYEYVQKNFSPIQRYRSIEFERDWNRGSTAILNDQNIIGVGLKLDKSGLGNIGYELKSFFEGSDYNANKHLVNSTLKRNGFQVNYNGSLLNSKSATNTDFYRHKSGISQNTKWITFGLKDEFELNKFTVSAKDSLLDNSYQFWEWQGYIQNADTTRNKYGINYMQRTDYLVNNSLDIYQLNKTTYGENYGAFLELNKNPNHQFKINATYRKLQIVDTSLINIDAENTLLSRIEYNFRLWKGAFRSNSFYEIGSGLEVKKQFQYIEVAAGQGVYVWVDYNDDGIPDLNEFPIATLPGTGTHLKVYTPTQDYIKAFSNQFSEMIILRPAAIWRNKKGIKKFASRFSNQAAYRIDRKSTDSILSKSYNPFLSSFDSTNVTLNSSFRNTLFINQFGSVFALDLTYQDLKNIALLTNGIDTRENHFKEAKLRWNMSQQLFWNITYKDGVKSYVSEYFESNNYAISYFETKPKFTFQPNTAFRVAVSFKYSDKRNSFNYAEAANSSLLDGKKATIEDVGVEIKYNVLQKGSLNLKVNYIKIKYNGEDNNALAFEMLEALQVGENYTWGFTYQRNLSNNMQLNLTYDGRKSNSGKPVHVGGAQIRAYF